MKTSITIADGEIHMMVVNYETEKRNDMKIPIEPHDMEHHEVLDKYLTQINNGLRVLTYTTL